MAKDNQKLATWLLLIGGLAHAVPALYSALSNLLGGPWIQVIIGIISVIVALTCFYKK